MHYFTPAKTLPEGTIYLTDLTHVADFADWLAEFETLLNQNRRFATVCTARPPRARISAAVSSSLSARRAHKTTFAPCSANSRAAARPMPDEAPITAAVLFFKFNRFDMFFPCGCG